MEPTESELEQEEAEAAAEIAARERRQAAKQEAVRPGPPEIAPQDIIFENGKAIIRPHARMSVAVSTMRLTFQDGSEWDISADIEFAGLSEEDFRAAYDAFLNTQAELGGLKGVAASAQQQILARTRRVTADRLLPGFSISWGCRAASAPRGLSGRIRRACR